MLFRFVQRGLSADAETVELLAREFGLSKVTAAVLAGRGVVTAEEGHRFFSSSIDDLRDPFGLDGMAQAAERIARAVERREPVVVYGDYDVDGVCATTIVVEYLRGRGADVGYYVPSRHTEGYGLNAAAVRSLAGAKLLITVDCGVTNGAEVALAQELGMDVIVTDHHECPDELPHCTVVNPKKPGQGYGFSGLCGAGVALKLVSALGGEAAARQAMDLAALATVADIVPLADENLAIVRLGLAAINGGARPGVRALVEVAGLDGRPVKSGNIAFGLAPRINAGGRMELSRKSVEMLLCPDLEAARPTARQLDDDNRERVAVEEMILREAVEMVERDYSFSHNRAIVLYRPHWNTGVTGIVASRIVERYSRPTILFGDGEGACYGSGRSVPGVHLFRALKACEHFFTRYGGHEQAAGCALTQDNIEPFRAALDAYLLENYPEEVFLPLRHYDAELPLERLDLGLARDMERLEPTGFGNPRPVFLLRGVGLAGLSRTADGRHLRMRFGAREGVEGIAFRQGDAYDMLSGEPLCDALVVPDVNSWMGRERVQAVVEHIRPQQGAEHAAAALRRAHSCYSPALQRRAGDPGQAPVRWVGWAEGMDMLADAVGRSCWGTLALCYTAAGAAAVVAELTARGLLGRAYVGVGGAPQAGRGENAVVLAPEADRLPAGGYDAVYVLDGPLGAAQGRAAAGRLYNARNCIIIKDNDGSGSLEGFFSREGLLGAFRAVRAALAQGRGPSSQGDWGWLTQSGIGPWRAEAAVRIFVELGLLVEREAAPWLAVGGVKKTDLDNSLIYRHIVEYLPEVRG